MRRRLMKALVTAAVAAAITTGISLTAMAEEQEETAVVSVIDRTTKLDPEVRESERPVVVGWVSDQNGTRYQLADGTHLSSVWINVGTGGWYFLDDDGYRVTGWQNIDGVDYYFEQDGHMLIGWQKINGNWYFFEFHPDSTRGVMYAEQKTPDGFMTDAEGVIQ